MEEKVVKDMLFKLTANMVIMNGVLTTMTVSSADARDVEDLKQVRAQLMQILNVLDPGT